jgi:leader peptidase (prepilin peptidase)/N-methyltransferase
MGSFAGASVWRLRAGQLSEEVAELERLSKKKKTKVGLDADESETLEYLQQSTSEQAAELARLEKLHGTKTAEDRSRCLDCGHVLAARDLIPLVSWLSTKGRCRYCQKKIGWFEPLVEVGTALTFTAFAYFWATTFGLSTAGIILLALWLAALTMLVILFVYDLKWFLLPDRVVFSLIGLGVVIYATGAIVTMDFGIAQVASLAGGVAVLGGTYFVLWTVSKGRWVGFGDVKLGVALGILLADWKLALLTLFLANLLGTLVVLPGLITRKLSRTTHVPFGPFLILGFFLSLVFGSGIIAAYQAFTVWLSSAMLML